MRSFLLFVVLIPLLSFSQNGSIKGLVEDANGPVAFANVGLVGTSFGVATDVNGKYALDNVPAGKYTIQISNVGFKTARHRGACAAQSSSDQS